MPKFSVEVEVTYRKTLDIFAADKDAAMEKAEEIVLDWANVYDASAVYAEPAE